MAILKWIPRLLILAIILFVIVSFGSCLITKIFYDVPDVQSAPWAIQSYSNDEFRIPSRFYLASDVDTLPDGTIVARAPWWSYDGKKYHKQKEDKPFPVNLYGKIDVWRVE